MVRLIATDLDGTLLDTVETLSSENTSALLDAAEAGVHIVVATGRPRRWLSVIDALRPADPTVVASNGAMVYHLGTDEVMSRAAIDAERVIACAEAVRASVPGVSFAVEYGDSWGREPNYAHHPLEVAELTHVAALETLVGRPEAILKLLIRHDAMSSNDLHDACLPVIGESLTTTFSMSGRIGLLELSAAGVSKASALAELMAQWQIEPTEAAAFGDMPNDLEMLRLVGHPFAMADAHPWLHGFARAGRHDEAGVGRAVRQLLDDPVE